MSAIRTIDDHLELANIGLNTHAQIDTHITANPNGTVQGQLQFWDNSLSRWVHSETSELFWDDTDKRFSIGEANPSAKFHIKDGVILADGIVGGTPVSGAGTRLMWIPAKEAFRAGCVTGTEWDDVNIGSRSAAFGYNGKASGASSTHFGEVGTASGPYSIHFGYEGIASNFCSAHFGIEGTASGENATHFGNCGTASGTSATHFGSRGTASGSYSTHFGYKGTTSKVCSTHFGFMGTASGNYSTHFGYKGIASGYYSTHFGRNGISGGECSWVGGKYMQLSAAADNSFAFGHSSSAVALTHPNTFYIFPGGTLGKVAVGTTTPATSAIMDLTSTTGALLLPRMTTAQRDALTAVNGMLLYNTTLNQTQTYENGAWRQI